MSDKSDFLAEEGNFECVPTMPPATECNSYVIPTSFKFYNSELKSRDTCHVSCLPSNGHYILECTRSEAFSTDCTISFKQDNIEPLIDSTDNLHSIEVIFYEKSLGASQFATKKWIEKERGITVQFPGINRQSSPLQPYERLVNVVEVKILLRLHFTTLRAEKNNFSQSYKNLLKEQRLCDVQFDLGNGETLGAHVSILAARSPVFAAMFAHDTQEARSKCISIHDTKLSTFETFLESLYCGCLMKYPSVWEAMDLYTIADKYQVEDIKDLLVGHLKAGITEDNALALLTFSDRFCVGSLKEVSLEIISRSGREICQLPQWEDFARNHPELCTLAIRRILSVPEVVETEPRENKSEPWSFTSKLWLRLVEMSNSVYQFLFC